MKPMSVLRASFAVAIPAAAWAQASLPTGANVVAGSASFSTTGNSMTVSTGSPRTIIDYSGFSVGAGNSVRFNQPTTSSATLNRVISTEVSSILGPVSSNGQVFLVNPNGIFVGPGGSFSGSSVYLSTGNISNADFLAENIRFDPPPAGSTIRFDGGHSNSTDGTHILTDVLYGPGGINTGGSLTIDATQIALGNVIVDPGPRVYGPQTTLDSGGLGVVYGDDVVTTGGTHIQQVVVTGGTTSLSGTGAIFAYGTGGSVGNFMASGTSTPPANITATKIKPFVTSGSVTFASTGNILTVTNSNGAIINWNSFRIGAGEVTRFAQPSASTAVLNRVTGDPVQIFGTLSSNGKVWLVDPAGNIVSPARVVSTDGLKLASVSIQTPNPVAAPAPLPRPAARPAAPSVPSGTSGLVDGTVTVRLSLVDAAPISLR